jgi:hypothetical protein
MRRLVSLGLAALGAIGIVLALPARPALAQPAHPLGNFSVNQAIGLDLYPDRVAVAAIVDLAELPTLQERPGVDANGDGKITAAESAAYNTRVCHAMAGAVALRVDGDRVQWSVHSAGFEYRPGSAGLHISRISCAFDAAADLKRSATVDLVNGYRADRIGWREITAAGHGVHIVNPSVPARSRWMLVRARRQRRTASCSSRAVTSAITSSNGTLAVPVRRSRSAAACSARTRSTARWCAMERIQPTADPRSVSKREAVRHTSTRASWVTSSASAGSRVMRRIKPYARGAIAS